MPAAAARPEAAQAALQAASSIASTGKRLAEPPLPNLTSSDSTGSNDSSCTNALAQIDTSQGSAALPGIAASPDGASPGAAVPTPAASIKDASPSPTPAASPTVASRGAAAVPTPAACLYTAGPAPSGRNHPAAVTSEGGRLQHTAATDKSVPTVDSSLSLCAVSTGPNECAVLNRGGDSTGVKASLTTGQTLRRNEHESDACDGLYMVLETYCVCQKLHKEKSKSLYVNPLTVPKKTGASSKIGMDRLLEHSCFSFNFLSLPSMWVNALMPCSCCHQLMTTQSYVQEQLKWT